MGGAWSSWSFPTIIKYFFPNKDYKLTMVCSDQLFLGLRFRDSERDCGPVYLPCSLFM